MSSRKRVECPDCGKDYSKSNLSRHRKTHSQDKMFECAVCTKQFSMKWMCERHELVVHAEAKPHSCEVCQAVFSYKWQVKHHMSKQHDIGRKWECIKCHKVFHIRCNLQAHMLICTTGEDEPKERVKCQICRKTFKSRDSLRGHIRYMHNDQRNHVCDECGKSFSRNSNLLRHMAAAKNHSQP